MKTILCIPGNWYERAEIFAAISNANKNKFIVAGRVMLNMRTKKGFEIHINGFDTMLKTSFKKAGIVNRIGDDFLTKIEDHKNIVYLIGDGGNLENAKEIADAGLAILKAGGIGIKIETTGKAFTKEHWEKLCCEFEESNLYEMYVLDSISNGTGTVYTCGMHNLGLKDAIISGENFQDAVSLLSIWGYYQLIDKPRIKSGQTFSTAVDTPIFEILDEENQPYEGDELFENSFGMWRLKRKIL